MDVVQEIEALVGRQAMENLDLEALEVAVRQQVLQLAGRAVEQRLNADTSDEVGPRVPCRCGGEAHFAGRRSKQFHTVLGLLRLERAYYQLFRLRSRVLSPRSTPENREHLAVSGTHAHDRYRWRSGQLSRRQ